MSRLKGEHAELRLAAHKAAADVAKDGGNRVIVEGQMPTQVLIALMNDGFAITPGVGRTTLAWSEGKTPWLGRQ